MLFKKKEPPIIISVGGSLIVPSKGIDFDFLGKLNKLVRKHVSLGKRFFIITGGGATAREYRDAGDAVVDSITEEDLDWLGIHATRLNGHLFRTMFQDIANPRLIENYAHRLWNWNEPVVIGGGWRPGWSTDYCAVISARDYGGKLIVNLSNIDWVYTKDPRKFKDAEKIEKTTWGQFEKLVGKKWSPGMNAPFDPIATQLAKSLRLTVIVTNGADIENVDKIISGQKEFKGTVISPDPETHD